MSAGLPVLPPELTLGDLPAGALTRDREEERQQSLLARAQHLSAFQLSRELALALRVEAGQVFERLTHVPDNMLSLLQSPEGWSALAEFVAAELGAPSPSYRPQRH